MTENRIDDPVDEEVLPSLTEEDAIDFFAVMPTPPKELDITNTGEVRYETDTEELIYEESVVLKTDTGMQIFAEKALVSQKERKVTLTDNVSVYNGPVLYRGDRAVYYYEEKRLDTQDLRTGYDPFLIQATSLKNVIRDDVSVVIATDANVTTDDYENPSYWLTADQVSIYPNQHAVFKNMKVKIGGQTVFWLPYMAQSLDQRLGYHFTPGGQSNLGFFWKNRYGMLLGGDRDPETLRMNNAKYELQLNVDPYSRRGLGLGADLFDLKYEEQEELGSYSFYWIYDVDPTIQRTRINRDGQVNKNRYLLEVKDRREFGQLFGGSLRLDTNFTLLSDRFFLEDYFEEAYTSEPVPDNLLSLTYTKGRSLSNVNARLPFNEFHQTDRRYPEAVIKMTKSPIVGSSLFHEGRVRVGLLDERLAKYEREELQAESLTATPTRLSEIQSLLDDRSMFRFHTWHEFVTPLQVGRGLTLSPTVGVGYTYYDGLNGNKREGDRFLFNIGLDASLKLSRTYGGIENERLGLKGLKHIIQPYSTLSFLDVAQRGDSLTEIDRVTPITRPRPVRVGRYSAIDSLDDWSIWRIGLRNQFLTNRNGDSIAWLYWDSYMDFLFEESGSGTSFSNLYSEIWWTPLPWLSVALEAQFPVIDSLDSFTELFLSTSFMVSKSTEVSLGYSYLKDHPQDIEDSNQVSFEIYHRMNEEWGVGMEHRWQFDDSTLEFQRYSVHRNMRSWILSAELYRRDFRVEQEWGFSVGFTLRDFPSISLPVGIKN